MNQPKKNKAVAAASVGVRLKVSTRDYVDDLVEKGEINTASDFYREAIEAKISGRGSADEIEMIISAGISRIEETARASNVNQEILRMLKQMNEKVATKEELETLRKDVSKEVSSAKSEFVERFNRQAEGYKELIVRMKEEFGNHKKILSDEVVEFKKMVSPMLRMLINIDEALQESLLKYREERAKKIASSDKKTT